MTAPLVLGPYHGGETPPSLTVIFDDSAGNPISLAGFTATFSYRSYGGPWVTRTAQVDADQVTNKGQTHYTWVAADFQSSGDFEAEMLVSGGSNAYYSRRLAWQTIPSVTADIPIAVPPVSGHVSTLTVDGAVTLTAGPLTLPAASVADAALSSNVALKNAGNAFTGANTFAAGQKQSIGTGDDVSFLLGGLGLAQLVDVRWGTAGAPVTTGLGPVIKVSKTESIPIANAPVQIGANDQGNALIWASSIGDANTHMQVTAGYFTAQTASTQAVGDGTDHDACGISTYGMVTEGAIGYGIGLYANGIRKQTSATGKANGLEVRVTNWTPDAGVYATSGASDTVGLWLTSGGDSDSAAAIQIGRTGTTHWLWGLGFTSNGPTVGDIRSDSPASTSILIQGTHSTAAMAVKDGSGPVLIGELAAQSSSSLFEAFSPSGTSRDPIARWGGNGAADNHSLRLNNGSGTVYFAFVAGGGNAFLTGTAAGDTGVKVFTAAKAYHIGGTAKVITVNGADQLGFFGVTPVGRSSAYTVTNPTTNRALNVTGATLAQLAQVVGTMVADLQAVGLYG